MILYQYNCKNHCPSLHVVLWLQWVRERFQTIFGKINVIVTLTFDPPSLNVIMMLIFPKNSSEAPPYIVLISIIIIPITQLLISCACVTMSSVANETALNVLITTQVEVVSTCKYDVVRYWATPCSSV